MVNKLPYLYPSSSSRQSFQSDSALVLCSVRGKKLVNRSLFSMNFPLRGGLAYLRAGILNWKRRHGKDPCGVEDVSKYWELFQTLHHMLGFASKWGGFGVRDVRSEYNC